MNPADPRNFFIRALEFVLKNEGGFVDHPADSGGPTNLGITISVLSKWRGKPVTTEDIKALEKAEVYNIYQTKYWLPIGADKLTYFPVALAMFDTSVLFGPAASGLYAQKALTFAGFDKITVDGIIGPISIAALNHVEVPLFLQAFHTLLLTRIESLIEKYPKNQVFKKGWENRINKYLTLTEKGSILEV